MCASCAVPTYDAIAQAVHTAVHGRGLASMPTHGSPSLHIRRHRVVVASPLPVSPPKWRQLLGVEAGTWTLSSTPILSAAILATKTEMLVTLCPGGSPAVIIVSFLHAASGLVCAQLVFARAILSTLPLTPTPPTHARTYTHTYTYPRTYNSSILSTISVSFTLA